MGSVLIDVETGGGGSSAAPAAAPAATPAAPAAPAATPAAAAPAGGAQARKQKRRKRLHCTARHGTRSRCRPSSWQTSARASPRSSSRSGSSKKVPASRGRQADSELRDAVSCVSPQGDVVKARDAPLCLSRSLARLEPNRFRRWTTSVPLRATRRRCVPIQKRGPGEGRRLT